MVILKNSVAFCSRMFRLYVGIIYLKLILVINFVKGGWGITNDSLVCYEVFLDYKL